MLNSYIRRPTLSLSIMVFTLVFMIPGAYAANVNKHQQANKHQRDPDSFTSWLAKSKITGQFREYYFTKKFQRNLPFRHSNSMGGWINVHTPSAWGLSADVGFATAQALGLNSHQGSRTNTVSLPDSNLTVLEQAYLQYAGHGFQFRAGDQPMETPLVQTDAVDFRMIKPTYQGLGASFKVMPQLTLYAYRMFRFKGYNFSGYERADTGQWARNFIAPVPRVNSIGIGAYGGKWHYKNSTAELWYYNFYNRLDAVYGEYNYKISIGRPIFKAVLLGAQYAKESNAGNQILPYQNVNSRIYGARIGFVTAFHHRAVNILFLGYNDVPIEPGAFRGGGFVSPYQQGNYDSPTFFTNNFGTGLVSETASPGHGYLLKDVLKFPKHHLLFVGEYGVTHAPEQYLGASGMLTGVGDAHSWTFVASYGFAPHWAVKFLYFYVDNNNAFLGHITAYRAYLTYTFPGT